VTGSSHPHRIRGGALGAAIGVLVGLVAVFVVDRLVGGDQNDLFWLPAAIVTGVFVGGMMGFLLAETVIGGMEDERETAEAEEELAQLRAQHQKEGRAEQPGPG
jgi:hypothetical protein